MSPSSLLRRCPRPGRAPLASARRGAALLAAIVTALAAAGSASASTAHTWYVAATATGNPACSAASSTDPFATVAAALACVHSGDTVRVGAGRFAGGFTLPTAVSVVGAGANQTTITNASSLNGPEVTVAPGVAVWITGMTIDGAVKNGGILASTGRLNLRGVAVIDTVAVSNADPAPVAVLPGTGTASLSVQSSTVSGNLGLLSGAIAVASNQATATSTATILDSTLSGNSGLEEGGAVFLNRATGTLHDDTVADNSGNLSGGLLVSVASSARVTGSILAGNHAGNAPVDCESAFSGTLTDGGHNLVGVSSPGASHDCGFQNGLDGDVTGTPSAPLNPQLAALANNGGPTQTQALLRGSPAINAGDAADCAATPVSNLDQRGHSRRTGTRSTCDIGAYDTGGSGHVWYVSHEAQSDPACSAASATHPFATLAGALACARSGDTVKLGAGTFAGNVTLPGNIVLSGAGATQTIVTDPNMIDGPEITVPAVTSATLRSLQINGSSHNGGVLASTGHLILQGVAVVNTFAGSSSDPAPVAVVPASGNAVLTVLGSTLSGNIGVVSGGISLYTATATSPTTGTIVNSTFAGNSGLSESGAVFLNRATAILRDDTIAGNSGNLAGGLLPSAFSSATVTDSLIAANTGGLTGGSDCLATFNGTVTDGGHNVIGVAAPGITHDCGFRNGVDGDLTGSTATPLNPQLAALADNGGGIQTEALMPGSPAIGAGNPADCLAAPVYDRDERGVTRAATTRKACDTGAYDTGGQG